MKKHLKNNPLFKIVNNSLIDLPTPINISYWWNFGSLLGLCLIIQVLTGLFLAIHYTADIQLAFNRVNHICRDVNYGWLLRILHANGASFFFICIFLHIGRGIYYNSYLYVYTWNVGILILFIVIGTAFIGYVLPWGQISFWGATVITNLVSAIPYLGNDIVQWLWGGFAVDNATLTRFFTFHFVIPFIVIALTIIHLLFLHQTGSNNPLGINRNIDKIRFHPYLSIKDIIGFIIIIIFLVILSLWNPYLLGDPDNFIPANPIVTPPHIQPEWYFLFAYAILRAIPNKILGVIALLIRIVIFYFFAIVNNYTSCLTKLNKFLVFRFIIISIVLRWLGQCLVEDPFTILRPIFSILYFGSARLILFIFRTRKLLFK